MPEPRPSGWPGSPPYLPQLPGTGIVYCLTMRDTDTVTDWLDQRDQGRGLLRRGRPTTTASGSRSCCCANEVKSVVATSRARHGLRQARPRLRRPLPGARLPDRLLPAGRPRRPRPRRGRTPSCSAAPRTATSRTSSSTPRSRRASRSRRCVELLGDADGAGDARRAAGGRQPRRGAARGDAEGPRGRGRRQQEGRAGCAHRRAVDLRRGALSRRSPRCAAPSRTAMERLRRATGAA